MSHANFLLYLGDNFHEMSNKKEGNGQESLQLPNTFRSKTLNEKKDALKVTAPQSNKSI